MTDYADLVPEVLEDCQGCPEPLIERNVRNAVIELCEQALVLRRNIDPITIEVGVPSYALIPPAGRSIVEVHSATIAGGPKLTPASIDQLDLWWQEQSVGSFRFDNVTSERSPMGDDWRAYTQARPQLYYVEREDESYRLRLVGIPSETVAETLVCKLVLKPTRDSTEVDSWLLEDFYKLLIAGAKAKTLLTPKTKWFEPTLGAMYMGKFDDGIAVARNRALRDFVRDNETIGHVRAWV